MNANRAASTASHGMLATSVQLRRVHRRETHPPMALGPLPEQSRISYNGVVNPEPELRFCPACKEPTPSAVCPRDGSRTVVGRPTPEADEDPEALVGSVFDGRYRVEAMLGRGGMGTVYRAMQLSVDRPVALKILNPDLVKNPDQVRRFYNEARAASLLEHPHTIRLYDFGQASSGHLYHVTELLDGEALSALIERRGRLPVVRTLTIATQILRGLADAHAHGIVHRDLKPENVFLQALLGEGDFIKVLDFGIAKMAPLGQSARRLTQVGTVVGTPLYMSPEQARGLEVDARSDLYSLGAVMFEMLVGAPPFVAENAVDIMLAHVQEIPPPVGLPNSPRGRAAEALILQLLAKTPGERPDSAEVVRQKIDEILTLSEVEDSVGVRDSRVTPLPIRHPGSITIEAVEVAPSGMRGLAAGIGALLVVAVGVTVAFLTWSSRGDAVQEAPSESSITSPAPAAPVVTAAPSPALTNPTHTTPGPTAAPAVRRDAVSDEARRDRLSPELAAAAVRKPAHVRIIRPVPKTPVDKPPLKVDKK